MNHRSSRSVTAALTFLVVSGSANAVNLLQNPTFATSIAGWTIEDPANSNFSFSTIDANGSSSSGSALVNNTSAGPSNGTGIVQCVNGVSGGATYTFAGKLLFPTGQATTGSLQIGLRWLSGPGCSGSVLGSQPRLQLNTAQATWVTLTSAPLVAPAGAVSAQFIAFPSKVEAGGTLTGQFDDLIFDGPAPPAVASTAEIPILGPWTLALLALALGAAGVARLRRR